MSTMAKGGLKGLSVGVSDMVTIPLDRIKMEPGFNLRGEGPELAEHIEALAVAYCRGDWMPPLVVRYNKDEDNAVIVDGHCRYRAAMLAQGRGAEIKGLACISAPRGLSEADLLTFVFTTQKGRKLNAVEKMKGVNRYISYGWDMDQIAATLGVSPQTINNWATIAESTPEVRNLVNEGTVAESTVVSLTREVGRADTTTILQLAKEEAVATGQVDKKTGLAKVTGKTVTKIKDRLAGVPSPQKPVRKTAKSPEAVFALAASTEPFSGDIKEAVEAFLVVWEDPQGTDDAQLEAAINLLREAVGRGGVVPKAQKAA